MQRDQRVDLLQRHVLDVARFEPQPGPGQFAGQFRGLLDQLGPRLDAEHLRVPVQHLRREMPRREGQVALAAAGVDDRQRFRCVLGLVEVGVARQVRQDLRVALELLQLVREMGPRLAVGADESEPEQPRLGGTAEQGPLVRVVRTLWRRLRARLVADQLAIAIALLQLPVGTRRRQHRRAVVPPQLLLDERQRLRERHVLRGVAPLFAECERQVPLPLQLDQLADDALHGFVGPLRRRQGETDEAVVGATLGELLEERREGGHGRAMMRACVGWHNDGDGRLAG